MQMYKTSNCGLFIHMYLVRLALNPTSLLLLWAMLFAAHYPHSADEVMAANRKIRYKKPKNKMIQWYCCKGKIMKKHNTLQNWKVWLSIVSTIKIQYDLVIIACPFFIWPYFSIKAYEKKKYGIPTSPQWKGLVPPVVQLYTMTFLGLGGKKTKEQVRRQTTF